MHAKDFARFHWLHNRSQTRVVNSWDSGRGADHLMKSSSWELSAVRFVIRLTVVIRLRGLSRQRVYPVTNGCDIYDYILTTGLIQELQDWSRWYQKVLITGVFWQLLNQFSHESSNTSLDLMLLPSLSSPSCSKNLAYTPSLYCDSAENTQHMIHCLLSLAACTPFYRHDNFELFYGNPLAAARGLGKQFHTSYR